MFTVYPRYRACVVSFHLSLYVCIREVFTAFDACLSRSVLYFPGSPTIAGVPLRPSFRTAYVQRYQGSGESSGPGYHPFQQ